MKNYIAYSFAIASISSISFGTEIVTFQMYKDEKKAYQSVRSIDRFGARISEQCFVDKKSPKCLAVFALEAKTAPKEAYASKINLAGNPAARFCYSFDSVNRIFKDKNGADYDFCLFNDGSFIDAWDLYKKHHKK